MVLGVAASGRLLKVVLIFKGQGIQVPPAEAQVYSGLGDVIVLWQKKAWIDSTGEKAVMKRMIKPYVDEVNAELGYRAEFLLTEDRGPGHDDSSARFHIFH
jgi:hypothetical protein